jgi:hypothetical protein
VSKASDEPRVRQHADAPCTSCGSELVSRRLHLAPGTWHLAPSLIHASGFLHSQWHTGRANRSREPFPMAPLAADWTLSTGPNFTRCASNMETQCRHTPRVFLNTSGASTAGFGENITSSTALGVGKETCRLVAEGSPGRESCSASILTSSGNLCYAYWSRKPVSGGVARLLLLKERGCKTVHSIFSCAVV